MVDVMADIICRPPRRIYDMEDLGPSEFLLDNRFCVREDLELINRKNCPIMCSWLEADELVDSFLRHGVSFFSMDFAGCGLSGGDIVTLGHAERQDLEVVLDFLKQHDAVSFIALYGRSMGAATALLVASDERYYHCVSGLVLDSCYASVRAVLQDLSVNYVGEVPLVSSVGAASAVELLRAAVFAKAAFDIDAVDVAAAAPRCQAPALFAHARGDLLVRSAHSHRVWEQYGGDKHLVLFDGDHNSARPDHFRRRARDFLVDCFLVPLPPLPHDPPHDASYLNVTYVDFCKAPS